jgi:hypothetical protein
MAERIQLHLVHGKTRRRRWRAGRLGGFDEAFIEVGELPDSRHYAARTGPRGGAWAFPTEREACERADRWIHQDGRVWTPHPAVFDAAGLPADGQLWRHTGQNWLPAHWPDERLTGS